MNRPATDAPGRAADLFTIVTPTLNSEAFLDETIVSVLSQTGDFRIRYHVQDGGSTDGTPAILEAWQARLAAGQFPIRCRDIRFSFTTSRDGGMYQAINRAFETARADNAGVPAIMGWINSDDRLAAGALATIHAVLSDLPEVQFVGSRVSLINEAGATLGVEAAIAYEQTRLAAGDYDGRSGPFVMQEGTFWTSALWDNVGGLDERFRLAGDWDLWRRFAGHAPLTTIDTILGFHRRRPGQLSESLDRYYEEVDRLGGRRGVAPLDPLSGAAAAETLPRRKLRSVAQYNTVDRKWHLVRDFGGPLARPSIHSGGVAYPSLPVEVISGTTAPAGAHPDLNLPAGIVWMKDEMLLVEVDAPVAGTWTLVAECRNWQQDHHLTIRAPGNADHEEKIEVSGHNRNIVLRVPLILAAGRTLIEIHSDRRPKGPFEQRLLIIQISAEIDAPASAADAAALEAIRLARAARERPVEPIPAGDLPAGAASADSPDRIEALIKHLRVTRSDLNLLRLKDHAIHR